MTALLFVAPLCPPMSCPINKQNTWHFSCGLIVALFAAACALPAPAPPSSVAVAPLIAPSAAPTVLPIPTATPTVTAIPVPTPADPPTATPVLLTPYPILEIPLAGPATFGRGEFSGLAWYGDYLLLLPQYPNRFGSGDGAFFVLDRAKLEAFVDGTMPGPLTPRPVPVSVPGLRAAIPGYEGFESIVFDGEQVYLTVEASPAGGMLGWILAGQIEPDMSALSIDVASAVAITPQAKIGNLSDEAIVLVGSGEGATLLTIYEANGRLVNQEPIAHRFAADLTPLEPLPFPSVEYRITDATATDANGRFWAINYFYPGDIKLKPGSDPLLRLLVDNLPQVERLVEFQIEDGSIRFAPSPPIYLQLLETDARNWEGVVRLGERGFLLVTDTHPRTILAYVAKP